jgi:hypothetical protein
MKMKYIVFLLALNVTFVNIQGSCIAQNPAKAKVITNDKAAINLLRSFYTSYITAVSEAVNQEKTDQILKKYCTEGLLKKIPKLVEESDGDPFLKAQDSDMSILKSLTIVKNLKRPDNSYIVSYIYDNTKTIINLTIVQQKNSLKINTVW